MTGQVLGNNSSYLLRMSQSMAETASSEDEAWELGVAQANWDVAEASLTSRDASVVGAVLMSAAAVEARVSEVLEQVRNPDRRFEDWASEVSESALQAVRLSDVLPALPHRLKVLWHVFGPPEPIDLGAEPFQSGEVLRRLRNALIHMQPVRVAFDTSDWSTGTQASNLESLMSELERLIDGGIGESHYRMLFGDSAGPSFPHSVYTQDVAAWAVSVATEMISTIDMVVASGEGQDSTDSE